MKKRVKPTIYISQVFFFSYGVKILILWPCDVKYFKEAVMHFDL